MKRATRAALITALAVVAVVSAAGCSSAHKPAPANASTTPAASTPTVARTPARAAPKSTAPKLSAAQLRAQAAAAVAKLAAGQPAGAVSVAERNVKTGASYAAGASAGMRTASAYKLFVLEALLFHNQQAGLALSQSQAAQATTAIENSDNAAGYDLFLAAGGNAGLASAAAAFGMTNTVPGRTDPTFTTTSASDFLRLLDNLVSPGALDPASGAYVLSLMRTVEADQRWGVGVVADPGTDFANKDGWLSIDDSNGPDEDDNGLWAVTSVGVVTVHGQSVLMSVFTQHQPSMAAGVTLAQDLAQAMIPAVAP